MPTAPLRQTITEDMKTAMKSGDATRLGTIRLLLAAIKQREVDERIELSDADIIAVIEKLIKQRKESITQFAAAQRRELVAREQAEIEVLATYLPPQADESEIASVVAQAIADAAAVGMTGPAAIGKVMTAVKAKLAGRADMTALSARVKATLTGG